MERSPAASRKEERGGPDDQHGRATIEDQRSTDLETHAERVTGINSDKPALDEIDVSALNSMLNILSGSLAID